jgi:hypothetical protein
MKNPLLFCFVFTSFSTILFAQPKLLEINFLNKSFNCSSGNDFNKEFDDLKEGDFYQIKICNINTYLYDISIESSDTMLESSLDFPSFTGFAVDNVTNLLSKIGNLGVSNSVALNPALPDTVFKNLGKIPSTVPFDGEINEDHIKRAIKFEQDTLKTLYGEIKTWNDLVDNFIYVDAASLNFDIEKFTKSKPDFAYIEKRIQARFTKYKAFQDDKEVKAVLAKSQSLSAANEELLNRFQEFLKSIAEMKTDDYLKKQLAKVVKKRIDFEKTNRLTKLESQLLELKIKIDEWGLYVEQATWGLRLETNTCMVKDLNCNTVETKVFEDRKKIVELILSINKNVKQWKQEYLDEIQKFKDRKVLEGNVELTNADAKVIEAYDAFVKSLDEAVKATSPAEVAKMTKALSEVLNHAKFEYLSLPLQLAGDQTKITITIQPHDSASTLKTYKVPYIFPRYKKYFIGTGSSFYFAGLYDESYSTLATITTDPVSNQKDTTFTIIGEDTIKFETGAMLTFNLGIGLGKHKISSLGLFIGPALSFSKNVRPRLALGINYAYGKRNKFSFGFGMIAGYSDRKSNATPLKDSTGLDYVYSAKPDVTISRLKASWMAHIGYIYRF